MMKPLLWCLALGAANLAQAQQPVQYSLHMFNRHAFNPAYAGLDNSLSLTGVVRAQWLGIEGAPLAQQFNAHLPWYYLDGAFGLALHHQQLGAERNIMAALSYAYHLPVGEDGTLSLGLAAGAFQKSLDGSLLRTPGGIYEGQGIDHQDQLLPLGQVSALAPIADLGIYYRDARFDVGLSSTQVNAPRLAYTYAEGAEIDLQRNYFFTFASKFDVSDAWTLQPLLLAKTDLTQWQAEAGLLLSYNGNIFGGASFRGYDANSRDAVVIMAGLRASEHLVVGYAYDLTLSGLNTVSQGSHELMVNYNLHKIIGAGMPEKIIYNPRVW